MLRKWDQAAVTNSEQCFPLRRFYAALLSSYLPKAPRGPARLLLTSYSNETKQRMVIPRKHLLDLIEPATKADYVTVFETILVLGSDNAQCTTPTPPTLTRIS